MTTLLALNGIPCLQDYLLPSSLKLARALIRGLSKFTAHDVLVAYTFELS